ncbi:MAG: hypothetical protein J2P45_04400 [Candidatus Dormibacteraeota bacterium]|nr:hypothetical protein [Candidatus Dormibacteraeota bacterium]
MGFGPLARPDSTTALLVALGAVGLILLGVALVAGEGWAVVAAIGLLGLEYAFWFRAGVALALVPLAAIGLLLVAELAFWSLDLRVRSRDERQVIVRRAGRLALAATGGGVLSGLMLISSQAPVAGSPAVTAGGAAAAVALLAILALLAWRRQ